MGLRMTSYDFNNKTAWDLIRTRFPVSLWFGITGFLLSYLVCIPLGIAKALRHGSRFDVASSADSASHIGTASYPRFATASVRKNRMYSSSSTTRIFSAISQRPCFGARLCADGIGGEQPD